MICFIEFLADFVSQNLPIQKFKGGDSVMWLSESDPQPATICWNSRISDKARIHLVSDLVKKMK